MKRLTKISTTFLESFRNDHYEHYWLKFVLNDILAYDKMILRYVMSHNFKYFQLSPKFFNVETVCLIKNKHI